MRKWVPPTIFLVVIGGISVLVGVLVSKKRKGGQGEVSENPEDIIPDLDHVKEKFFRSNWTGSRTWIGPEWWANPLQDWDINEGSLRANAASNRTLSLLPFSINQNGNSLTLSVLVRSSIKAINPAKIPQYSAGFRFGRKGGNTDFRSSVISPKKFQDATINGDGSISMGGMRSSEKLNIYENVNISLTATRNDDMVTLKLSAYQNARSLSLSLETGLQSFLGSISLLADGPHDYSLRKQEVFCKFLFTEFSASGDFLQLDTSKYFGPILWTQYALSNNQLRIQAQVAAFDTPQDVSLYTKSNGESFDHLRTMKTDPMSRTATFTIKDWDGSFDVPYQVRMNWQGTNFSWAGTIRKEPKANEKVSIACFSCDNGYAFPLPEMNRQVARQDPDIMFFAGDQIYEDTTGGFHHLAREETNLALLDFFRKYYQFGWTWRNLMKDRPSIFIPDDHDVYQGNLFGNGGTKMENKPPYNWIEGGYIMPGEWLNAVERVHVGHLPDPAVDMTLPIGIRPYFTSINYGGLGLAVLEDRKFKTAPLSLPKHKQESGEGGTILGNKQEEFLRTWASNWEGHELKIALSQSIFANAATHEGLDLTRSRWIYDSNGWPKAARNRVVRIMGNNNVFAIHGDQHLGVLLRHGTTEFDDAGYAFMVPGTANYWPRAWWPGVLNDYQPSRDQCFLGKIIDDAGHPLHILAVGNPDADSNTLVASEEDPTSMAYKKGSGYGLVVFDKNKKTAEVNLYRYGENYEQFDSFPKTIFIGGEGDTVTSEDEAKC